MQESGKHPHIRLLFLHNIIRESGGSPGDHLPTISDNEIQFDNLATLLTL